MASGCGGRPAAITPAVWPRERRAVIERHHHVEFTVRVSVVVATGSSLRIVLIVSGAIHLDGRDAEPERLFRRLDEPSSAILATGNLYVGCPALVLDANPDQAGQILVELAIRAVLAVEPSFNFVPVVMSLTSSTWRHRRSDRPCCSKLGLVTFRSSLGI